MYRISCMKERPHTTSTGEHRNCDGLLTHVKDAQNCVLVEICKICGQKWEITIEDGMPTLRQLPKDTRFEIEDKLKAED